MASVSAIVKNHLCLGCGLCEAVHKEKCLMQITDKGFYQPKFVEALSPSEEARIMSLCPSVRIAKENAKAKSIWGEVCLVSNAWASESDIRKTSSSGGVTSALAIYLLESKKVDAVLHVGACSENFLYNKLQVSRSREDILRHNASRYAPAAVFNDILDILETNQDSTFAFIGKPCDIAGMQNLLREYSQYGHCIKYYLAIFCAGTPSYNASWRAIKSFNKDASPIAIRYRGDGWPGYFTVSFDDGTKSRMTYNESWGNILGRDISFRCKICPDGIGLLADISSGDAWNTSNGYPDFTESEGKNFCFVRTQRGEQLFNDAARAGYIQTEVLDVNNVRDMQPYQFERRHYVGWRIAAVQLLTGGILNFQGLGFYRTALKANYYRAFRELVGTFRRFLKLKKDGK